MTQAQAIAEAVKQVLAANGAVAPKEKRTKAEMLSAKDRALKATFTKRGIKDVVLMDRDDLTKPFNVRPYGKVNADGSKTGWLALGRQVRKGETSVRGLFHETQTDLIVVQ
jgi:hypothetical protein